MNNQTEFIKNKALNSNIFEKQKIVGYGNFTGRIRYIFSGFHIEELLNGCDNCPVYFEGQKIAEITRDILWEIIEVRKNKAKNDFFKGGVK